jgi:hypothetical protein
MSKYDDLCSKIERFYKEAAKLNITSPYHQSGFIDPSYEERISDMDIPPEPPISGIRLKPTPSSQPSYTTMLSMMANDLDNRMKHIRTELAERFQDHLMSKNTKMTNLIAKTENEVLESVNLADEIVDWIENSPHVSPEMLKHKVHKLEMLAGTIVFASSQLYMNSLADFADKIARLVSVLSHRVQTPGELA